MKSFCPRKSSPNLMLSLASVIFLMLLCASSTRAQEIRQGNDVALVRLLDALLDTPALRAGFQGVEIQSLKEGSVLYSRNAEKVFLPASNNKLLTSGAAFALLGSEFAYSTRLVRTGTLALDGTLRGDLILIGSGDPILEPDDIAALARQAAQSGIRRVVGRIAYDDSRFDKQRLGDSWAWDDEPFYYSAQISALNVNENLIRVVVTPGKQAGSPVSVAVAPLADYVTIHNTAKTGADGTKATLIVERERGHNALEISGSLPLDAKPANNPAVFVTIEDPSRFAASLLAQDLEQAGVRVDRAAIIDAGVAPVGAAPVAEHISPTLPTILKLLNKPSDNLIAECLLKTVGAAKKGQGTAGQDGTGASVTHAWLTSIGIADGQVQQADGSGLSRVNFVSPHSLVQLLTWFSRQPRFNEFYDSLPIAGVDGSLRNRLRGTKAANNCRAKTGYVSHASSLSGYVTTADGEPLVFSILMNNHLTNNATCTAIQDKIIVLIAEYQRPSQP